MSPRLFTIELRRSELEFIRRTLPQSPVALAVGELSSSLSNDPTVRFELDRPSLHAQLDALSDLFAEIGLGENDEPNAVGHRIESLIDRFNEPLH